ncbi:unnamed protein product [Dicrocoelium dendriticum]|nr:unnamed protein product [Dicrocoelium dendriticum]
MSLSPLNAVPSASLLGPGYGPGVWPLRERLALATALLDVENQQASWPAISRRMARFGTIGRPDDWCSARSCAKQYALLLDSAELTRRQKTPTSAEVSRLHILHNAHTAPVAAGLSVTERLVKCLTAERVEELRHRIRNGQKFYSFLKTKLAELEGGLFDSHLKTLHERLRILPLAGIEVDSSGLPRHSSLPAEDGSTEASSREICPPVTDADLGMDTNSNGTDSRLEEFLSVWEEMDTMYHVPDSTWICPHRSGPKALHGSSSAGLNASNRLTTLLAEASSTFRSASGSKTSMTLASRPGSLLRRSVADSQHATTATTRAAVATRLRYFATGACRARGRRGRPRGRVSLERTSLLHLRRNVSPQQTERGTSSSPSNPPVSCKSSTNSGKSTPSTAAMYSSDTDELELEATAHVKVNDAEMQSMSTTMPVVPSEKDGDRDGTVISGSVGSPYALHSPETMAATSGTNHSETEAPSASIISDDSTNLHSVIVGSNDMLPTIEPPVPMIGFLSSDDQTVGSSPESLNTTLPHSSHTSLFHEVSQNLESLNSHTIDESPKFDVAVSPNSPVSHALQHAPVSGRTDSRSSKRKLDDSDTRSFSSESPKRVDYIPLLSLHPPPTDSDERTVSSDAGDLETTKLEHGEELRKLSDHESVHVNFSCVPELSEDVVESVTIGDASGDSDKKQLVSSEDFPLEFASIANPVDATDQPDITCVGLQSGNEIIEDHSDIPSRPTSPNKEPGDQTVEAFHDSSHEKLTDDHSLPSSRTSPVYKRHINEAGSQQPSTPELLSFDLYPRREVAVSLSPCIDLDYGYSSQITSDIPELFSSHTSTISPDHSTHKRRPQQKRKHLVSKRRTTSDQIPTTVITSSPFVCLPTLNSEELRLLTLAHDRTLTVALESTSLPYTAAYELTSSTEVTTVAESITSSPTSKPVNVASPGSHRDLRLRFTRRGDSLTVVPTVDAQPNGSPSKHTEVPNQTPPFTTPSSNSAEVNPPVIRSDLDWFNWSSDVLLSAKSSLLAFETALPGFKKHPSQYVSAGIETVATALDSVGKQLKTGGITTRPQFVHHILSVLADIGMRNAINTIQYQAAQSVYLGIGRSLHTNLCSSSPLKPVSDCLPKVTEATVSKKPRKRHRPL